MEKTQGRSCEAQRPAARTLSPQRPSGLDPSSAAHKFRSLNRQATRPRRAPTGQLCPREPVLSPEPPCPLLDTQQPHAGAS